jgi:hypothetical protein
MNGERTSRRALSEADVSSESATPEVRHNAERGPGQGQKKAHGKDPSLQVRLRKKWMTIAHGLKARTLPA